MATPTNSYVTLDQIVNHWLLSNGKTIHSYLKSYTFATEAVRELSFNSLNLIQETFLTKPKGQSWWNLPSDYTDWVSVGIRNGEFWRPVGVLKGLMPFPAPHNYYLNLATSVVKTPSTPTTAELYTYTFNLSNTAAAAQFNELAEAVAQAMPFGIQGTLPIAVVNATIAGTTGTVTVTPQGSLTFNNTLELSSVLYLWIYPLPNQALTDNDFQNWGDDVNGYVGSPTNPWFTPYQGFLPFFFSDLYNDWGQMKGRQFGIGDGTRIDSVVINVEQGIIVCPKFFPSDYLYLAYVSTGNANTMTKIPKNAQAAIEAYITWKYFATKRNRQQDAAIAKANFDNQHRLLRSRNNTLTTTDVKRTIARGFGRTKE
jgi:hypothetical protein